MPRHTRPRLDVILRVPRYEPYKESKRNTEAADLDKPTSSNTEATSSNHENVERATFSSTSSAEWNSLLIWARKMRGPQWDSSVGMWMVDRFGDEYYRFCNDPNQSVHQPIQRPSTSIPTSTSIQNNDTIDVDDNSEEGQISATIPTGSNNSLATGAGGEEDASNPVPNGVSGGPEGKNPYNLHQPFEPSNLRS
ncbi:unnamed protein product [Sympodiomycopsis kandeliae]